MLSVYKKTSLVAMLIFFSISVFGMSKTITPIKNAMVSAAAKISSLFGRASSSVSPCTVCDSRASIRTPTVGTAQPRWYYHPSGQLWTQMTLDAIDREGLAQMNPKDATNYCPNWNKLTAEERRAFWLMFASKLSEQESDFNPRATYREKSGVSSNGLFSMSKGDICGLMKTTTDTFDEKKNIDCAIKTMRIYLTKYGGYIGTGSNKGLGYYWQPLQDNPKHLIKQTLANKQAMLNYTRSLPFCILK